MILTSPFWGENSDVELFHRLPRFVQLDLGLLVLLVRCRVDLPLNHPNMSLLILGDKCLVFYLGLDRSEVLVERRIVTL